MNDSLDQSCPKWKAKDSSGVCCNGAYFQQFSGSFIHPCFIIIGLCFGITSFLLLSQLAVTGSDRQRRVVRKYWKPAHFFIKVISLNACLYFVTLVPMVLAKCFTIDSICSVTTGAYGYASALLMLFCFSLGNEWAHWCSYSLIVFYGIERHFRIHKIANLSRHTARICYFLSIQLAFIKSKFQFSNYIIRKDESSGEFRVVLAPDRSDLAKIHGQLYQYSFSIAIMAAAVCLYFFIICHKPERKESTKVVTTTIGIDRRQSMMKIKEKIDQCEQSLTFTYVIISSLFLLHLISANIAMILIIYYENPDKETKCNVREFSGEIANYLQHISEICASAMGMVVVYRSRIFSAVRSFSKSLSKTLSKFSLSIS